MLIRSRRAVLGLTAAVLSAGAAPAAAVPTLSLLLAADQASGRVLLLDPGDPSWLANGGAAQWRSAERAALWSWSALDDDGLGPLDPQFSWQLVSEAKYRIQQGRQWVLTCASEGLAAVLRYPAGGVCWATAADGNVHTIELLPDGNVAIAASEAGYVRLYAASQGPRASRHVQLDLPGAHGLHWDAVHRVLWALGSERLLALAVGGTPADPRLTPLRDVRLPDPGGHDLAPVAQDHDRLWVATGRRVFQYSVGEGAFVGYPGARSIDRPGVKSVGDDPVTGQVLTVTPSTANPCPWCTSTVEFHRPDGSRRIEGTGLYKARWTPRPVGGVRSAPDATWSAPRDRTAR
ncbi:hypothetical protein P3T37_007313 [Kitasatospora sp. MAA4]|uniref:DUF6528 family protein n=1 Tax=Kitasatospora sp. MAA4 TaxID=3035093 RepID=UPI0024768D84|nr:DUF6528 family protein [Kitasatospora sp. MAA4]MDH6137878.1 hypothetical protein [Kitasatospora sp. MAA4]